MRLPRLHLVELEDLPWLPAGVRDVATDYLRFMEERFALHEPALPLLEDLLTRAECTELVDFCSGGGGPVPALVDALVARGHDVTATLSDLYPNAGAFERVAAASGGRIGFVPTPVDARAPQVDLNGAHTLFNALHHFAPHDVRAILYDATSRGAPVAVFEIPERRLSATAGFLLTPLIVWITTPMVRPITWRRLLWTYLLPAAPLVCTWDGVVSHLRAYHPDELLALAEGASAKPYVWEAGTRPFPGLPLRMTYLTGRARGDD